MRRLPVYLLVDVSGSMLGEKIESVKSGIQMLVATLHKDPQALETAYLRVITVGSNATQVVPLTELAAFQQPELTAGGMTAMGEALELLCKCAQNEVVKTTAERKGDWRLMVFIFTDGMPNDDVQKGISALRSMKWGITVSCAAGQDADTTFLDKVTPECVVKLEVADSASISAFFKWVSSSVSTSSKSVNETGKDVQGLDQLPPPPPEVKIV